MTIDPAWATLSDEQGPALRYVEGVRDGRPIADLATVVAGRTTTEAAAAASQQLPGWLVSTEDADLAERLVAIGAMRKRHSFVMQCNLLEHPAGDTRIDDPFAPMDLPVTADPTLWTGILPSWRDAFPPSHPDHLPGDDATAITFLLRLVDGSDLGPMHRSSTVLVDREGTALAGIMVNIRPQDPPVGGPWIADIWRDPSLRGTGIGTRLIDHAKRLLAEDGLTYLCLAVTAGNDAQRTYESAGFSVVSESRTVLLPD